MIRLVPCLRSLALATSVGLGALVPALHAADVDAGLQLADVLSEEQDLAARIDLAGLRAGMAQAGPTALWFSPEGQTWREHVTAQIALLADEPDIPPFLSVLLHGKEAVGFVSLPEITDEDMEVLPDGGLLVDLGESAPAMRAWLEEMMMKEAGDLAPSSAGPYQGANIDELGFMGFAGDQMAIGMHFSIANAAWRAASNPGNDMTDAPSAFATFRLGQFFEKVLRLEGVPQEAFREELNRVVPGLGDVQPLLGIGMGIDGDGWVGQVILDDLPPALLATLDQRFHDLVDSNQELGLALHLPVDQPMLLAAMLDEANLPADDLLELLVDESGDMPRLLSNGNLFLGVKIGVPLPMATIALGVDEADQAALQARLGEEFGAFEPAEIAGASAAWTTPGPMDNMPLTMAIGNGLFIMGSDPAEVARIIATPANSTPASTAGRMRIDCKALAQAYLPMAYGMAQNWHEEIGHSPISSLRWTLPDMLSTAQDMSQDGDTALSFSAALEEMPWLGETFAEVGLNDAAAISQAIAVYQPSGSIDSWGASFVMRSEAGYYLFRDGDNLGPMALTAVQGELAELEKTMGPELAALKLITVPEVATLDARWLPPLAPFIDGLPLYEAELTASDSGLRLRETGLPLVAAMAASGLTAGLGDFIDDLM